MNFTVTRLHIPHSRNYGETGASKGLWDRFGRQMGIAPMEKKWFPIIFLASKLSLTVLLLSFIQFLQAWIYPLL